MEKQDYSKFKSMSISSDLPIAFVGYINANIDDFFKNLGINTLEDLFIAYDNGIFNDKRKKFNMEVKGQTEILMSYYLGTPLIGDHFLEMTINIKDNDNINSWVGNRKNRQALLRLGLTDEECSLLYEYCINKKKYILADENHNARIMEIVKEFASDEEYQSVIIANTSNKKRLKVIQNIKFKADFFEKYLENKRYLEDGLTNQVTPNTIIDRTVLQSLEVQMEFLLKAKSNIDVQIELLQSQLITVKNAGGIRK